MKTPRRVLKCLLRFIKLLATFIVLFTCYCSGINRHHLKQFALNSDWLSVTSFIFNEQSTRPPLWVERVLGKEAVYWQMETNVGLKPEHAREVTYEDILKARTNFARRSGYYTLPKEAFFPDCYMEMMAFARLGITAPFLSRNERFVHPTVGNGSVTILSNGDEENIHLDCYYRALYSNWRVHDSNDTFWSVLVYCPVSRGSAVCRDVKSIYDYSPGHAVMLRLQLAPHPDKWSVDMETYRESDKLLSYEMAKEKEELEQKLAVCTVWPYATMHEDKVGPNQALIYEFLRYYSNLGIMIMVYDRDGMNMEGVFESDYAKANMEKGEYRGAIERHLFYSNFTIASMLLPDSLEMKYDTERAKLEEIRYLDNDKTLTYDHCRFDLKAKYGIERSIVIDFDEFLYCKEAAPTPAAQSAYIHNYLLKLGHEGVDQVSFGKTTITSKVYPLGSVHDCINRELALNSAHLAAKTNIPWWKQLKRNTTLSDLSFFRNHFLQSAKEEGFAENISSLVGSTPSSPGSVFNCFGSIQFIESIPNVKSIHLNHGCPHSSMHDSCSPCAKQVIDHCIYLHNAYDCVCNSKRLFTCDFMHLSSVDVKYSEEFENRLDHTKVMSLQTEPFFIANALNVND